MSARFLTTLAVALAFAGPAIAAEPPAPKPDPAHMILKALDKEIAPAERNVAGRAMTEVLTKLSEEHGVAFVIIEEQFKAAKVENIKGAKSPLTKIEAEKLTLRQFLNVWLASIDAAVVVRPDYVEIVPLSPAKVAQPAPAPEPPAKKPDPTEALLAMLFEQEVQLDANTNLNDVPLYELLMKLSKQYAVNFVIQEELFRAEMYPGDIKEAKTRLATTNLRGLSLHHFLKTILGSMDATYMVKGGTIEVVTPAHAARVTKAATTMDETGRVRLAEPLVSLVVREKPLNEAAALIAERYDLTVVVSPKAGDAKTSHVTARILNVPAVEALELLAVQNDLRVVRKANAFLITTREHAKELSAEKLEKERQQIELDKFRAAPPPRPQPEPKNDFPIPPGLFQPNGQLKGQFNGPYPNRIKPLIVNPKPQPPK